MSFRRLIIPLHDIKFTHEEVSTLLSKLQNKQFVQADAKEFTTKKNIVDEDITSEEDTQTRIRNKKDDRDEPEEAFVMKKQASVTRRINQKKLDSEEDSDFDGSTKGSDNNEENKATVNVKKQTGATKRTKDNDSEESEPAVDVKSQKCSVKRNKYNKIESDEDSKSDESIKYSDVSRESESQKDVSRSTQRTKYKKIKINEDSESDEDTKNNNGKELPGRSIKKSTNSAGKTKYEEINIDDDSATDDDIKLINSEEPKAGRSGRLRRFSRRTRYREIDTDEDTKSVDSEKPWSSKRGARKVATRKPPKCRKNLLDDEYDSDEETSTDENSNSERDTTEEELSIVEDTTATEEESSSEEVISDLDSSSSEKSDSPPKKKKSANSSALRNKKGPLSEYEKLIEKRREEKMAFLKSIKIDEIKEDLKQVTDKVKEVKKKKKRAKRHKLDEEISKLSQRSSKRENKKKFNYSEDALYDKNLEEALGDKVEKKVVERQFMPAEMSYEKALKMDDYYKYYIEDVKIQESKLESDIVSYDKSILEKLTSTEPRDGLFKLENVSKKFCMTALAWYPSENLILAGGCTDGNLGIWNVNSGTDPYIFGSHFKSITHLQFNPFNHNQVITSSADGTMRSGDMVKKVFNQLYVTPEDTRCNHFDFVSESLCLVAQQDGKVAILDTRTNGNGSQKLHPCLKYMKTVSVHPVNRSYFITAGSGFIRLWDLRKLQEQPITEIRGNVEGNERGAQFAYFSPVTGNSILVSSNHSISLYNSTNLTERIWLRKEKKRSHLKAEHRAAWLTHSDQVFSLPSPVAPRGLIVYDLSFRAIYTVKHKDLINVGFVSTFHPFRPALAVAKRSPHVLSFFMADISL